MPRIYNDLESYMASLRATFDPQRAAGHSATLQYIFTGAVAGAFYIVVNDGTLQIAEGRCVAPNATVTSDFDVWLRVVSYELDPLLAYQDGLYQVDGSMETLIESDLWFRRKPTDA